MLGAYGPALLDEFEAAHPNVSVLYWESNDALCEQGLLENRYDLALCVSPVTAGSRGSCSTNRPSIFGCKKTTPPQCGPWSAAAC